MRQPNSLRFPIGAALKRCCRFPVTWLLPLLLAGWIFSTPAMAQSTNKQAQINALNVGLNGAIEQVKKIVNQPVTPLPRKPGMRVSTSSPGWYHEGAGKPYFKTVDVRTTQQTPYDGHEYVTSDLNPGVVFLGRELEFNRNTKYFYTDRSLPKKRLTEPEMLEINRLYRVIWRCQNELNQLKTPTATPETNPSEKSATEN